MSDNRLEKRDFKLYFSLNTMMAKQSLLSFVSFVIYLKFINHCNWLKNNAAGREVMGANCGLLKTTVVENRWQ